MTDDSADIAETGSAVPDDAGFAIPADSNVIDGDGDDGQPTERMLEDWQIHEDHKDESVNEE